jgi:hypothetical protein
VAAYSVIHIEYWLSAIVAVVWSSLGEERRGVLDRGSVDDRNEALLELMGACAAPTTLLPGTRMKSLLRLYAALQILVDLRAWVLIVVHLGLAI